jgi:putative transposase
MPMMNMLPSQVQALPPPCSPVLPGFCGKAACEPTVRTGFVYLAAILDAYSRKVIGYAVSTALDTNLTLEALKTAIDRYKPGHGVIHHSDQGVQYASTEYVSELKSHGFEISMARAGNPYENARMESFF